MLRYLFAFLLIGVPLYGASNEALMTGAQSQTVQGTKRFTGQLETTGTLRLLQSGTTDVTGSNGTVLVNGLPIGGTTYTGTNGAVVSGSTVKVQGTMTTGTLTTSGTGKLIANVIGGAGNTLYVDAVNGNDSSGRPYLTIAAAKGAAVPGKTILVLTGTYNEQVVLDTGINYNFADGAVLNYTGSGATFVTGTSPGQVKISGHGCKLYKSGTATNQYVFDVGDGSEMRWHIDVGGALMDVRCLIGRTGTDMMGMLYSVGTTFSGTTSAQCDTARAAKVPVAIGEYAFQPFDARPEYDGEYPPGTGIPYTTLSTGAWIATGTAAGAWSRLEAATVRIQSGYIEIKSHSLDGLNCPAVHWEGGQGDFSNDRTTCSGTGVATVDVGRVTTGDVLHDDNIWLYFRTGRITADHNELVFKGYGSIVSDVGNGYAPVYIDALNILGGVRDFSDSTNLYLTAQHMEPALLTGVPETTLPYFIDLQNWALGLHKIQIGAFDAVTSGPLIHVKNGSKIYGSISQNVLSTTPLALVESNGEAHLRVTKSAVGIVNNGGTCTINGFVVTGTMAVIPTFDQQVKTTSTVSFNLINSAQGYKTGTNTGILTHSGTFAMLTDVTTYTSGTNIAVNGSTINVSGTFPTNRIFYPGTQGAGQTLSDGTNLYMPGGIGANTKLVDIDGAIWNGSGKLIGGDGSLYFAGGSVKLTNASGSLFFQNGTQFASGTNFMPQIIDNNALLNNSITIGTTNIPLGATVNTFTGLLLTTSTFTTPVTNGGLVTNGTSSNGILTGTATANGAYVINNPGSYSVSSSNAISITSGTGGGVTITSGSGQSVTVTTGSNGTFTISATGTNAAIQLAIGGTNYWKIDKTGNLICNTDNVANIGASGDNRPANVYARAISIAGSLVATQDVTARDIYAGQSNSYSFTNNFQLRSPSNGVITLYNWANTGFTRLQFGGTSASFVGLSTTNNQITFGNADGSSGGGVFLSGTLTMTGTAQRGSGTLVSGSARITTPGLSATTAIIVVVDTGASFGALAVPQSSKTSGTAGGFSVVSALGITDTSTFDWVIVSGS